VFVLHLTATKVPVPYPPVILLGVSVNNKIKRSVNVPISAYVTIRSSSENKVTETRLEFTLRKMVYNSVDRFPAAGKKNTALITV
jgi:hypothetical protein